MTKPRWRRVLTATIDHILESEHLTIGIWRDADGFWRLNCAALRIDGKPLTTKRGKPIRKTGEAKARAIMLVADHASWLMRSWRRELRLMKGTIDNG